MDPLTKEWAGKKYVVIMLFTVFLLAVLLVNYTLTRAPKKAPLTVTEGEIMSDFSKIPLPVTGNLISLGVQSSVGVIYEKPSMDSTDPSVIDDYKSKQAADISTHLASFNATLNELLMVSPDGTENAYNTNGTVMIDEENLTAKYYTPDGELKTISVAGNLAYVPLQTLSAYQSKKSKSFDDLLADAKYVAETLGIRDEPVGFVTHPYFGVLFEGDDYVVTVYYDDYETIGYNVQFETANIEKPIKNFFNNLKSADFLEAEVSYVKCGENACDVVREGDDSLLIKLQVGLYDDTSLKSIEGIASLSEPTKDNVASVTKSYLNYRFELLGQSVSESEVSCVESGEKTGGVECYYNGMRCGQSEVYGVVCWYD